MDNLDKQRKAIVKDILSTPEGEKKPKKPTKDTRKKVSVTCGCGCGEVFMTEYANFMRQQKKGAPCFKTREHYYHYQRQQKILKEGDPQRLVQWPCPGCGEMIEDTYEKWSKGKKFHGPECQKEHLRKKVEAEKQERKQREEDGKVEVKVMIPYTPHPGQLEIHKSDARFKLICAGTRWGKDRASINELIYKFIAMLDEDRDDTLVPRVLGWLVAPTFPLARQLWRELKYFFPPQWVVGKNEAERQLYTAKDGIIEVKSADQPDSLTAVGVDICLLSEAPRCRNLEEVWSYIRGRLASPARGPGGNGGAALINGTPKGKGYYYQMYLRGQNREKHPEWQSWQFPTSANPYIKPGELEEARRSMTERMYRQEFEADFNVETHKVFPYVEENCILPGDEEPKPGMTYEAGYDPAKRGDPAGFTIRDRNGRQVLLRRWVHRDYDWQVEEVTKYCRQYNHAKLLFDRTGIGEVIETALLQRLPGCEGIFFTNQTKDRLVNNLSLLMERKAIALQNDPILREELDVFDYEILPSGRIRYSAPSGLHDDIVTCTGLAYYYYAEQSETLPYLGLLLGVRRK